MKECEVCGREYESKRASSRYCSGKCRKLAFQGRELSVPGLGLSVPAYVDPPLRACETYNEKTGIIRKQCLHVIWLGREAEMGIDYTLDQNGSRLVHVPEGTLGRKRCVSEVGDRYCSCGAEIHGTVRPRGKHEVLLTSKTRHLYSYFTDYRGLAEKESQERIRRTGIQ